MSTSLDTLDSPAPLGRLERRVLTPEGVELHLKLAPLVVRLLALIIDLGIILALMLALGIVSVALVLAVGREPGEYMIALSLILFFLLRNFYFTFFELRWRGMTPAKRLLNLRVVGRRGERLGAEAIFVRNLTRDLELFLPFVLLISAEQHWPATPWAARVFACLWGLLIGLMPLFNADKLRLGDLLAGTMVISVPSAALHMPRPYNVAQRVYTFAFTHEQLDMYGVYELQVLGDFLDQYPDQESLLAVCEKVATKLDVQDERWRQLPGPFLQDLHHALRARREQRLLFGERQETKKQGQLKRNT